MRPAADPAARNVVVAAMTPGEFIAKWRTSELKERSAAQEHFIDLCRLLGEPTPAEADPTGEHYCFERGARKDALRRVSLLPIAVAAIVPKPLLDQPGKLVELRSAHRRCASVARRHRKLKYLPHALA